jgi:hypothetical protein
VLLSWNIERDVNQCKGCRAKFDPERPACPDCGSGEYVFLENDPVPATKEGLLTQDQDLVMAIINAYSGAVGSVDSDLGKDSNSGGNFPEVSIPMDPLSKSPGNSLKLS